MSSVAGEVRWITCASQGWPISVQKFPQKLPLVFSGDIVMFRNWKNFFTLSHDVLDVSTLFADTITHQHKTKSAETSREFILCRTSFQTQFLNTEEWISRDTHHTIARKRLKEDEMSRWSARWTDGSGARAAPWNFFRAYDGGDICGGNGERKLGFFVSETSFSVFFLCIKCGMFWLIRVIKRRHVHSV